MEDDELVEVYVTIDLVYYTDEHPEVPQRMMHQFVDLAPDYPERSNFYADMLDSVEIESLVEMTSAPPRKRAPTHAPCLVLQ